VHWHSSPSKLAGKQCTSTGAAPNLEGLLESAHPPVLQERPRQLGVTRRIGDKEEDGEERDNWRPERGPQSTCGGVAVVFKDEAFDGSVQKAGAKLTGRPVLQQESGPVSWPTAMVEITFTILLILIVDTSSRTLLHR
jgi:hypothetical protein